MLTLTVSQLLPPQASLAQEACQAVARAIGDESGAIGAGAAFTHALADPEVTKSAYEDIKTLSRTVVEIRGKFVFIGAMLTMWDLWATGKKDSNGHEISLYPEWQPLCDVSLT